MGLLLGAPQSSAPELATKLRGSLIGASKTEYRHQDDSGALRGTVHNYDSIDWCGVKELEANVPHLPPPRPPGQTVLPFFCPSNDPSGGACRAYRWVPGKLRNEVQGARTPRLSDVGRLGRLANASSSTWKSSTTASADTRRLACPPRSSMNCGTHHQRQQK